jgi:predicted nucleic acid-binding protein
VTLFLDANVIIYLLEGASEIRARVIEKLSHYKQSDDATRIAVSRLSWLECRVRPLRDRNRKALTAYESFFSQADLAIVELTAPVVETAAQIRAALNFSTPDALQSACALQIPGLVQILSNDRRFARIPGIKVIAV